MGKSPARWIKSVLFGKKTSRSNNTKGRNASKAGNDKAYDNANGPPASTENSPVISEPVLVSARSNDVNAELKKGNSSSLGANASFVPPNNQGAENHGNTEPIVSSDPEKIREEQAAIKAQAVFRGFLARRAFRALKGIIMLQALVRGHLVRRQAIVTLHSILGIIKLQALVRGHKVRASGFHVEVNTKFCQEKAVIPKNSMRGKLYSNAFVCKLLSSSLVVMPLLIQYDQGEPNSVASWMELWTVSRCWKPLSETKKTLDSKSHAKRGGYAMETESVRPKRCVRKNSPANGDTGRPNVVSEPEKHKRNMRKVTSSDSAQDLPQSELEKVKRNLRKVSSSYAEASERSEIGIDTQSRNIRKIPNSPAEPLEEHIDDSLEKMKKDITLTHEPKPVMETASKSARSEGPVEPLVHNLYASELNHLSSVNKDENVNVVNGELSVKEEHTCNENQKRRRSSFSAKSEYAENGAQNTTLPSYMQATESAKAKLRAQNSPSLDSDSAENNGIRRHSLPLSTNGKVSSHSPRTHRILHASTKGGIRSDRSLLSSRDGNEKLIQVDWRR